MRPSSRRPTERTAVVLAIALLSAGLGPAAEAADDLSALYDRAMTLYKAGSYVDAIAAYEAVYAVKPIPEALYGIARCHHQLARYGEAAEQYEKFLAAAPEHSSVPKARDYLVEVLTNLASEAAKAEDHEPARKAYARAVELRAISYPAASDATSGKLLVGLGSALAGLEKNAEAEAVLRRALKAALAADVRLRTEALLLEIGSRVAPETGPTGEIITDPEPPPRGGSKVGLILGIGAGAVVVAGVVVVLLLFLPRPLPAHDLAVDWRRP